MQRCAKCGQLFKGHPAMSRVDGSPICSDCGVREAMESMNVDPEETERVLEVIHRNEPPEGDK